MVEWGLVRVGYVVEDYGAVHEAVAALPQSDGVASGAVEDLGQDEGL